MIRNETRQDRDWYGIPRTPATPRAPPGRPEVHEVALRRAPDPLDATPEERLLDEVCDLEARATQYEDLDEAARAVIELGLLKERIPVDLRAHVVTTCLFLASKRPEDDASRGLRTRRDRAREALRSLRAIAPRELVWEIDELLATGEWNLARRFPRAD